MFTSCYSTSLRCHERVLKYGSVNRVGSCDSSSQRTCHNGPMCLTFHDLGLLHTASLNRVESAPENRNRQRNFLVARNGRVNGQTASLALHVYNGAPVAFGANTEATERDKARSARLAAALEVHAANSSLFARTTMDWLERCGQKVRHEITASVIPFHCSRGNPSQRR